jgi:HlyD family secretion protein
MKRLLFWLIVVALLGAGGMWGYFRLRARWRVPPADRYRVLRVTRGDITSIVTSSGTVQPVQSVQIGSFVSGPIQRIYVDFNSRIKKGDLLAEVDPRTYKAAVAREEAGLAYKKADVERVRAMLEQSLRNEERVLKLRAKKKTFISDSEVDQATAERKSWQAQLKLGEAAVREAEATLASARTNLEFTVIKSPVDGIVVDRKVDPGQTLASQFQTPVMFVVSPDLEKKIYVYASVDEADMGSIRTAERSKQPVRFTVDAYPNDVFEGRVFQVRLNPTTVQNVVTYTVVVESPNTDLKLLPGMTASLAFQIEKRSNVLRVPNAALRFQPKPADVRPADRPLLEKTADAEAEPAVRSKSAVIASRIASAVEHTGTKRRLWVLRGELLEAVEVTTGLSDTGSTELVSGKLSEGQELVTGTREPPSSP